MATQQTAPNLDQPILHLIGGEKGGVGKSFFARTLVQFCLDHQLPFVAFDTDRSNPDLHRLYGKAVKVQLGIFSEGQKYEDSANQIYNTATTHRTICNLPAQVMPSLKAWFSNNDLLDLAAEDGVQFVHWFVSDGGFDSTNLLQRSLNYFGSAVGHIVVQNIGTGGEDWSGFGEESDLNDLLTQYKVPIIQLPRFNGTSTRNRLDRENLTFAEALDHKRFTSLERQRVRKYLREAYAAIEHIGEL